MKNIVKFGLIFLLKLFLSERSSINYVTVMAKRNYRGGWGLKIASRDV